jgi:predicted ester cyclase
MSQIVHITLAARAVVPLLSPGEPAEVTARNETVIRTNLEKINRGDAKGAAADWSEDTQHFGRWVGREGVETVLGDVLATFPDYHLEIVDIVAADDVVVVRCNVSGTHLGVGKLRVNGGMLVGVQPTGKRHQIAHIHWYTLRDGKIVQQYATRDEQGMMRQLGLLQATPPPAHRNTFHERLSS